MAAACSSSGPKARACPAGEVLEGEDYLIDPVLRVPLQTAGFRYQRLRPFGLDGGHLYAWIEGAPYRGNRPHAHAALSFGTAEQAATRLRAAEPPAAAAAVLDAAAVDLQAVAVRPVVPGWALARLDQGMAGVRAERGSVGWRPGGRREVQRRANEIHVQLAAAGVWHGFIEGENLDMAYPPAEDA
jgi:hypothetical protein